MKKLCFGLMITIVISSATAISAQTVSKAVLRFATDEYRLTPQQEHYLDSFAVTLHNIPDAYNFVVAGHTDSIGSGSYNKTLSYNRAKAVAAYLESKGFRQNKMKLEAKGFTKPIADNSNENNKERNRRVEIEFYLQLPEVKKIASISLPAERHQVDEKGGTVITASGTKITVPPDAFVDANGKPIIGKVNIEYTEYRDPVDFLLSDIPMHFNNGKEAIPFNSAGMFTVNAAQGNTPVYLKDGKRVNVGFNYDGTVRDLNFYRWDAATRTWKTVQPLKQTLLDQFKDYMLWRESDAYPSICVQHNDLKQVFFVNTGLRFSEEDDNSIYRRFEAVQLYDLAKETKNKQALYERKAKLMLRKYQVSVDKHFLAKTAFKLEQIRGRRDKSTEMMESITFRKNLSNSMIDSLERMTYDDYSIRKTDSGLALVLYKGTSTVTVNDVTIKKDESGKNFDADKWLAELEKYYQTYKTTAKRYRDTARSFEQQCDFFNSQMDKIYPLTWSSLDTLNCFRQMHDSWMSAENKRLSLAEWLLYYHKNKSTFASIYKSIQETEDYAAIEQKVMRFNNLMMLYRDPSARLSLTSADVQLPGNFSLSSLGTYNCDQLQRLEEPVILYAQYTNKQGKEIRPVIALLIDSKLNGILRYDGNYGYSPYHFAFSPKSSSRMILVDGNGDSYLVKPEEFAVIDLSLGKTNNIHTFTAEPIGKATNKDELREKLAIRN